MNVKLRTVSWITVLAVLTLCGGCSSRPPTRYYALSVLADDSAVPLSSREPERRQVLGVGPIALPAYLDHPSITTRSDDTTLFRSDLHRWGGSLHDEVSRVLVENLDRLLPEERFIVLPWMETAISDFRVQISISRFEGVAEQGVVLHGSWLLFGGRSTAPLAAETVEVREAIEGDGYRGLVLAMSRCLVAMGGSIAGAIIDQAVYDTERMAKEAP